MTLLSILGLVAACGGGDSGRDPTLVTGDVASASAASEASRSEGLWRAALSWLRAEAVAQVPGVTVSILNTDRSTVTDDAGLFRLEVGQFGTHNLRFEGNGADGTLTVVLPFGGVYELVGVEVNGSDVDVDEQRITFRGPITGIDCQQRLLQVLSGERVAYRVRLVDDTTIRDEDGESLTCPELSMGREAEVFSVVDALDVVVGVDIQVNPSRVTPSPTPTTTPTPEPSQEEELAASPTPTRTPSPMPTEAD